MKTGRSDAVEPATAVASDCSAAPAQDAAQPLPLQRTNKKDGFLKVGPIASGLVQLAYLAAAWTFCVAPGIARGLPGMRCANTCQVLLHCFTKNVRTCLLLLQA